MKKFLKEIFPGRFLFPALAGQAALFTLAFFFPGLFFAAQILLVWMAVMVLADLILLFRFSNPILSKRSLPVRLSNGDENPVAIFIKNLYPFRIFMEVRDETPVKFDLRDLKARFSINPGAEKKIEYKVHPKERGEYHFGNIFTYSETRLRLLCRRIILPAAEMVPAYPSFIQMKKFELLAISSDLTLMGIKKVRKRGQQSEFEHIRDYALGDDIRSLNWKATARRQKLMINQFMEERAQQVYNIIDTGRAMQMPFDGMTLLDYSINASLALSNIILKKHDRAGIITYGEKVKQYLPAERRSHQLSSIINLLYNQQTNYPESSVGMLYSFLRYKVTQRSLLFIYTNYETLQTLNREIRFYGRIARFHLPVVIIFENTELTDLINSAPQNTEQVYQKVIGEKLQYEKKQIVKELKRHGIHSILTPPEQLSVNAINKYLELKSRGLV